ncbi:MAG: adenylosuccinate lyase [Acidobacteriota bacterium]
MIERYSRPEMTGLFSDEARFAAWLEVELAVLQVLAQRKEIPLRPARAIQEKAGFDLARIREIEAEVHHDVIAFLTSVAERVGPEARYLHYGLTSSDVVDTALSLTLVKASGVLLKDLEDLAAILKRQAQAHRRTVMIGRTHGIHAEPTTLGLKFLLWYADVQRAMVRMKHAREEIRVGKISGAVGTFAHLDPKVEEGVCAILGLKPAPISTQVIQRDRHAVYVGTLGLMAAMVEKIATEIRHLQRTEVREVEEPFIHGQKGSSAMPHKRNPVGCENLSGLARVVRGHVQAALENVALWHERDISHSSVERVILPDASILLNYMLRRLERILSGLHVYPERMRENLHRMGGLTFSGGILLALVRAGVSREQAYHMVQSKAMQVWAGAGSLQELLAADPEVTKLLPQNELMDLFDENRLLRHIDAIYQRVLEGEPEAG